jgi:hypothetical protein
MPIVPNFVQKRGMGYKTFLPVDTAPCNNKILSHGEDRGGDDSEGDDEGGKGGDGGRGYEDDGDNGNDGDDDGSGNGGDGSDDDAKQRQT